ncbi:hypothetical protein HWD03_gp085 [Alteromonas phage vB_AmeM_PT11-V22]|uniref:Uncharacterized protein n=1 Tax=Alteromonas phage vB_AmeM_PT11-V22 TaxID=2704031 RepID=A0A6C0R1L9_9CAUD|nr:hypothetical protein HWD03_gp085 [Alteromonas phage vB_AmeM_PT11-V22]QHZ59766.1 hypothetical protein [Alteromonas phage vB_AmeM_PT11-V22]
MKNGKYRLKDDNGVEIEVENYVASFTKVGGLLFWHVGEKITVDHLDENSWERIPDESPTFKKGDRVKRKDGTNFSNGGYVVTVDDVTDESRIWLKETATVIDHQSLELVQISSEQPTPTPHKYADVIKAWADGYEVQSFNCGKWNDVNYPTFNPDLEWRIKPDNPNQDRILEIENTITELQNELEELKRS